VSEVEVTVHSDEHWTVRKWLELSGAPDMRAEYTSVIIRPELAELTYVWRPGGSGTAKATLNGPRRKKSGELGLGAKIALFSFDAWPEWLQAIALEHAPEGWKAK
jgi:hypothetical protein